MTNTYHFTLTNEDEDKVELNAVTKNGVPGWQVGGIADEIADPGQFGIVALADQSGGSGQKVGRDPKKYMRANGWLCSMPGILIPRGARTDYSISTDADEVAAATRAGAIFAVADEGHVIITPKQIYENLETPVAKKEPPDGCVFTGSHARFGNRHFFGAENADSAEACTVCVRIAAGAVVPITVTDLDDGVTTTPAASVVPIPLMSGPSGPGGALVDIVVSHLGTDLNSTTPGISFTTLPFTSAANCLLLADVESSPVLGTAEAPTSLTTAGLTWALVESQAVLGGRSMVSRWRAVGAVTAQTIAVAFPSGHSQSHCKVVITQYANVDFSTGSNGSGAIAQTVVALSTGLVSKMDVNIGNGFTTMESPKSKMSVATASFNPVVTTLTSDPSGAAQEVSDVTLNPAPSSGLEVAYWPYTNVRQSVTLHAAGATAYMATITSEIRAGATATDNFHTDPLHATANRPVLIAIDSHRTAGAAVAPTSVSGGGMAGNWTLISTQQYASTSRSLSLYWAFKSTTPTPAQIDILYAAAQDSVRWSVVEFPNVVITSSGADFFAAANVKKTSGSGTALATPAYSAFTDAVNNVSVAFFGSSSTETVTKESDFTQIHEVNLGGALLGEYKVGQDDPTADTAGTVSWGGIAIEVKAAIVVGSYNSHSFDPPADSLVIVAVHNNSATFDSPTNVTGPGLTYDFVDSVTVGTQRLSIYRALVPHDFTGGGQLTFNFNGVNQLAVRWSIVAFSGVNAASGANGISIIIQDLSDDGTGTNPVISIDPDDPDNAVYAAFGVALTTGVTPDPEMDELHEQASTGFTLQTEWKNSETADGDAEVTLGSSVAWIGIALEIARAPVGQGDYTDAGFEANFLYTIGSRMFRLRHDAETELWYASWTDQTGRDDPSFSTEYPVTGAKRTTAGFVGLGGQALAGISTDGLPAEFYAIDTEGNFTPVLPEGLGVTDVVAAAPFLSGQAFLLSGSPRVVWFKDLLDVALLELRAEPPDDTLSTAIPSNLGGLSGLDDTLWAVVHNQIVYGLLREDWAPHLFESLPEGESPLALRVRPVDGQVEVEVLIATDSEILIRQYLLYDGTSFPESDVDLKSFSTSIQRGEVWVSKEWRRIRGYLHREGGTLTVRTIVDGTEVGVTDISETGPFTVDLDASALGRGGMVTLETYDLVGSVELPLEADYYYVPSQTDLVKIPVLALRGQTTAGGTIDARGREQLEEELRALVEEPETWTLTFWDDRDPWTVLPLEYRTVAESGEAASGDDGSVTWLTLRRV